MGVRAWQSQYEVLRRPPPGLHGPGPSCRGPPKPLVYGLPYGALGYNGYALPYAAPVAYAHAPYVYNALDTGLVYPVAEAYVHDPTGDAADDASPAAEAYVHDATGDVSDNSSPEAEAYVHDTTGDA